MLSPEMKDLNKTLAVKLLNAKINGLSENPYYSFPSAITQKYQLSTLPYEQWNPCENETQAAIVLAEVERVDMLQYFAEELRSIIFPSFGVEYSYFLIGKLLVQPAKVKMQAVIPLITEITRRQSVLATLKGEK